MTVQRKLSPGDVVADKYEIESVLGVGSMGKVFRAAQRPIGRPVALKVLHPHALAAGHGKRFEREAKAISNLHHPNTITLLDYGQDEDGHLYMVTELLSGQTLDQILCESRRLAPERVVALAIQVAASLSEAHAKGVLHRDIKPSNIFVSDDMEDHLKVLDFGIAKLLDPEEEKLTRVGNICGTPEYMAPEQSSDGQLDGRTDLYSLAVMMWEMLEGRLPYRSGSPLNTVVKHQSAPIPPLGDHVPEPLAHFVYQGMSKSPQHRYADAAAFGAALEAAWAEAVPITAVEIPAAERVSERGPGPGEHEIQRPLVHLATSRATDPAAPSSASRPVTRRQHNRRWVLLGALALGMFVAAALAIAFQAAPGTTPAAPVVPHRGTVPSTVTQPPTPEADDVVTAEVPDDATLPGPASDAKMKTHRDDGRPETPGSKTVLPRPRKPATKDEVRSATDGRRKKPQPKGKSSPYEPVE